MWWVLGGDYWAASEIDATPWAATMGTAPPDPNQPNPAQRLPGGSGISPAPMGHETSDDRLKTLETVLLEHAFEVLR
jgi:hypothetical protein